MRASLEKSHFSKFFLFFFLSTCAFAQVDLSYKAQFISRAAYHLYSPSDLASHRHIIEAEQNAVIDPTWRVVAGMRAYADAAFSMNSRYHQAVQEIESSDFAVRDFYLEYKRAKFLFRGGSQQVAWGESFGFFFADLLNPKDTREFGLGGDLSAQRVNVPMLNAVLFSDKTSLQLILIPKPYFNWIPSIGNDFALPYQSFVPEMPVSVRDPRTLPFDLSNTEFGFRATGMVAGWDLGLIFFSYRDRRPVYSIAIESGNAVFVADHTVITSAAITGSKDLGKSVLRFETVYTKDRSINSLNATALSPTDRLSTSRTDEWVGLVGYDYTGWTSWRLSLQASHTSLLQAPANAIGSKNQSLLSINLGAPVLSNHNLDVIFGFIPQDSSHLLQLQYYIPLSSRPELTLGGYLLSGSDTSNFGQFKNGSRAFIQLKGFLGS